MRSLLPILACLVVYCDGLANMNPMQDILDRFSKSNALGGPRGEALLQKLDLQASREPQLAKARLQQVPNLLTAAIPAVLRAASGVFAQDYTISIVPKDDSKYTYFSFDNKQIEETGIYKVPNKPIILYEFEACPFCRKVREACSMLSLPVTFRPTPSGGRVFRQEVKSEFGEKATFPFMKDPNTGVTMFESQKIVEYLFKVYGNGNVPFTLKESPIVPITAGLGVGLARLGAGGTYRPSNPPSKPVTLWAYEGSPFCKIVRETLCALEIPHTVIHTPRGSQNRQKLWEQTGRCQVPFLEDPNTDVELFESEAIVEYLEKMYSVSAPAIDYL